MKDNLKEFISQTKWMIQNWKKLEPYAKHHMLGMAISSISLIIAIITFITVAIL